MIPPCVLQTPYIPFWLPSKRQKSLHFRRDEESFAACAVAIVLHCPEEWFDAVPTKA